jgi:hypothetical protein
MSASDGQLFQCRATHAGGMRCASVKREANHWFLIFLDPTADQGQAFACLPFDEEGIKELTELGADVLWVCGQACAQRLFERFLLTGKIA